MPDTKIMIPIKLFGHKIFRLINRLFQPDVIALGAATFLYGLIFWSVNRGVSIDEGFYLMGYLKDQALGPFFTDFHNIVRFFIFFLPDDDVLGLRITRVVLTIIAIFIFTKTSYKWLKQEYDIPVSKLLYYSLGFLAGAMCFSYASPVLYYDNIQPIIYLFSFALFFGIFTSPHEITKYIYALLLGFLLVFSLTNYITSGLFLTGIMFLFIGYFASPHGKTIIKHFLLIIGGMVLGIVFYSLFINDFWEFLNDAFYTYQNFCKPKTNYR